MFKWFKKSKQPQDMKSPEKKENFSTSAFDGWKPKDLSNYIIENAFPVVPDFKNAEGVAMDSGANGSSLKAAYTLQGSNLPQGIFAWYVSQGFIGHQACGIIAQNWLVDKACSMPAKDAVRKGYEITSSQDDGMDEEKITELRSYDAEYKIDHNLVEFGKFRRVFGIRICMFDFRFSNLEEKKKFYENPFNIDGVKKGSYKGMSQVDPYWITPELDQDAAANPMSPDFYEPTWWQVNGIRIHRSHLIVTRYSEVVDTLKPSYLYGGMPLTQLIYERVYAAERTANEAPQLVMTKRLNMLKLDLTKAVANQKRFEERMQVATEYRDNYGILVTDNDEEYSQLETALADVDAVIMTNYQLVAAVANQPVTKLMGTSPKGFNATGEFEMNDYHEMLESDQVDSLEPLLVRHYDLLSKSIFGEVYDFNIVWNPLKSMTDKDIAEVNEIKSRTDNALAMLGAIDGDDVRNRIIADEKSGYEGIEAYSDEQIEGLPDAEGPSQEEIF